MTIREEIILSLIVATLIFAVLRVAALAVGYYHAITRASCRSVLWPAVGRANYADSRRSSALALRCV
jgi:hypothetical protein